MSLGQEEIPETELLCLCLELFHDRGYNLPSLDWVFRDLSVEELFGWDTLLFNKVYKDSELLLCVLGESAWEVRYSSKRGTGKDGLRAKV